MNDPKKKLQASEHYINSIFRAAPVGIGVVADRVIIKANDRLCSMTGYSRDELLHRNSRFLYCCDSDYDMVGVEKYQLIHQHGTGTIETRWKRKDGTIIDILLSSTPLNPKDLHAGVTFTAVDITASKQAQADMERLKVAIEYADEVIVITDTQGDIQYANPAFTKTTGYTFKEAYRQNPRILKSGQHDETFYRRLWSTITSGKTWSGRMVNRKKDGTLYTEDATISPVFNEQGAIVNFVAIKRDITEQLKLEEQYLQAQKMESIGRLTGGVAHDFNNILSVIIGYTEMCLEEIDSSHHLYADLEKIHDAGLRSAGIIRQLLAFSRKQTIVPKILHLNDVVAGMLKMLHRLIGENIELIWKPGSDLPPVKMDPAQIDQILANLCVNARDAISNAGAITIRTDCAVLEKSVQIKNWRITAGDYVTLSFSDTGCGMTDDVQGKIFEPFFTTKGNQGTGLGLATVYGIIKQNNGYIVSDSEPGKGTTFTMYLPAHAQDAIRSQGDNPESQQPGRGELVLLVEDDLTILDLGRTLLKKLGYRTLTTSSPQDALDLAKQHVERIDLLITDVIMPEMNGKELSERLTRLHPELHTLYMSGYPADVIAPHGVLEEDVVFLQKPFSSKQLSKKIRQALEK